MACCTPEPIPINSPTTNPIGRLAPDFELRLYRLHDESVLEDNVSLSDFRQQAVVVNFWAPSCPPCRAEMPYFQKLWAEVQGKNVVVLGVDLGSIIGLGNETGALDLARELSITYPIGHPIANGILEDYEILGMPTTVFIDSNGEISRVWIGAIDHDKLRELTLDLIS